MNEDFQGDDWIPINEFGLFGLLLFLYGSWSVHWVNFQFQPKIEIDRSFANSPQVEREHAQVQMPVTIVHWAV